MTTPLCKCGCGEVVERRSYETDGQWRSRSAKGLYRAKCAKNLPAHPRPARPLPTLELVSLCYDVGEGRVQVKEKTPRDEAFRSFTRTFDCCECGWPAHMGHIENHHIRSGGMAIKASDYESVPLCGIEARGCHAKADKSPESYEKYLPVALMLQTLWIKAGHKIKKGGE